MTVFEAVVALSSGVVSTGVVPVLEWSSQGLLSPYQSDLASYIVGRFRRSLLHY